MSELSRYITNHVVRGACMCGECIDTPSDPSRYQPKEHTSDLQFFKIALKDCPDKEKVKEELIRLIKEHNGEFCNIDLFDGKEHNFIDIGGWIGDQGLALMLMGMGKLLELWTLLTPNTLFPDFPDDLKMKMAGSGFVAIKYVKEG